MFFGLIPSGLIGLHSPGNSFLMDVRQYLHALARTRQNFTARAVRVHTLVDTQQTLYSGEKGEMVKSLNWYDPLNTFLS